MPERLRINRGHWRLRDIWLAIGTILLILWILFVAVSLIIVWTLDRQRTKTMQGVLEVGASRLDSRLEQMENFLTVTLVSDAKFSALRNTSIDHVSNLRQIALQMEAYGQYFPEFSGIFYYGQDGDILLDKQWNDISVFSYSCEPRRMEMLELMTGFSDGNGTDGVWKLENVYGVWTAFYVYYYQGQYLGIYVSLDGILNRIIDLEEVDGFEDILLTDPEGTEMTGDRNRSFTVGSSSYRENGELYIQLTESLGSLPAKIIILVPGQRTGDGWMVWWSVLLILAVLSGLFLLYLLRTLQNTLFAPLSELNRQMKVFSGGNLETHISELACCQEVRELTVTFNEMTDQIRDMKIENYEKRLENQETVLKYLQIQKNPHFFLNVLNVIYALTASGNLSLIRTITLELIKHVRYVLSVDKTLVPLEEELEFTRNYLEIQSIRFPYEIRTETKGFDDKAGRVLVPPLFLQTFVENAVKYALSPEDRLSIRLEAVLTQGRLEIRISDSGPGFPGEMLQELNRSGTVPADERGEHIGIHNVLARMKLIYGDSYRYCFSNPVSGGALVEFVLPVQV